MRLRSAVLLCAAFAFPRKALFVPGLWKLEGRAGTPETPAFLQTGPDVAGRDASTSEQQQPSDLTPTSPIYIGFQQQPVKPRPLRLGQRSHGAFAVAPPAVGLGFAALVAGALLRRARSAVAAVGGQSSLASSVLLNGKKDARGGRSYISPAPSVPPGQSGHSQKGAAEGLAAALHYQSQPAVKPTESQNAGVVDEVLPLPLAPVRETLRQIDPESVRAETADLDDAADCSAQAGPSGTFVDLFCSCTPYIKMHQGKTVVIHITSHVLDRAPLFDALMEEISILALLGVRPVVVVGAHSQIEESLAEKGLPPPPFHEGMRVTDEATMRVVQEQCGVTRARVEGALARGRARTGPGSKVGVDVVSGNSFYTAQPVGIRNGVDFGRTGSVRSVDKANIQQHLDAGTIVLLSSLGYSPSGNVFNVRTEKLASVTAAELNAWKLIYVTPERLVQCNNDGDNCHVETAVLRSLRVVDAQALVKHERSLLAARSLDLDKPSVYDLCDECVGALQKGVLRAHLLSPAPGALITELYTTDGVGTLISRDVYEGIRLATAADVPSISALIEPLVAEGTLVERPADVLTCDVEDGFYYVYMRDNVLLACAHLKRFSETHAEIGCFCVSPTYRRQGCGDAMLSFVERTAAAAGVEHLFALSTHTMLWFEERGFSETSLAALPEQRVAIYNHQRGSKIYIKALSSRLIDAQELVWLPSFPLTPPTFSN